MLNSKFPLYFNDGFGRDTYISSNNGGFSTYNSAFTNKTIHYDRPKFRVHKDFSIQRPINKYVTDGGGRDFYIYKDILNQHNRLGGERVLPNILRSSYEPPPIRLTRYCTPSKFEKKLINRIFYGKCPGMKERQLSPKVKFRSKNKYDGIQSEGGEILEEEKKDKG